MQQNLRLLAWYVTYLKIYNPHQIVIARPVLPTRPCTVLGVPGGQEGNKTCITGAAAA